MGSVLPQTPHVSLPCSSVPDPCGHAHMSCHALILDHALLWLPVGICVCVWRERAELSWLWVMHLVWVIVHAIHFNIAFSTSLAIRCYSMMRLMQSACIASGLQCILGCVVFVTIHPQEVLAATLKGCSRNTKCSNGTEIDNPGHWSTIAGLTLQYTLYIELPPRSQYVSAQKLSVIVWTAGDDVTTPLILLATQWPWQNLLWLCDFFCRIQKIQ